MDFQKLIDRVKNILLTPKTEWPVIAAETTTVPDLFKNYIIYVAAIPAVFSLIAMSIHFLVPGIIIGVVSYVITLGVIYVISLLINAFAGTFGGTADPVQALKSAAYSYTAVCVAGVGALIPFLGILVSLAGLIYAIYLLNLGLPSTMKCPPEKSIGYAAVVMIIGWVISFIVGLVLAGIVVATLVAGAAMGAH